MNIRIRYFASLRETTGQGEETLDIPEETSVIMVRRELTMRYPTLEPILQRCISAVNRHYVNAETTLHADDELAFIPPMGGGELSNTDSCRRNQSGLYMGVVNVAHIYCIVRRG